MGSSHGEQTIQGACVSETAVHDHGRRLNQREFRPMAEVAFRPARQLSEYKGKGASASRERRYSTTKILFCHRYKVQVGRLKMINLNRQKC